jgi:hypothetical protein
MEQGGIGHLACFPILRQLVDRGAQGLGAFRQLWNVIPCVTNS